MSAGSLPSGAADAHLREQTVRREKLLEGRFLKVVRDTVRLPDGGESYREFVLHPGEDPLLCAQRELLEETGYSAREWAHAGTLHPCIGYADEGIEIWFARGLTLGQRQLDEAEFLDVITATPAQLLDGCRQGLVTDGKTLTCALWLQNVLSGHWVLDWRAQSAA